MDAAEEDKCEGNQYFREGIFAVAMEKYKEVGQVAMGAAGNTPYFWTFYVCCVMCLQEMGARSPVPTNRFHSQEAVDCCVHACTGVFVCGRVR